MLKPPGYIIDCLTQLESQGHEAYLVGGCVRDSLMGRIPSDWDICTSALPEQTTTCFNSYKTVPTGITHGTITVIIDGHAVEITTYRTDGAYLHHRKPQQVTFTPSLQKDLIRRDFTVNAMAWNPHSGFIDPFGGQQDLSSGIIRCVGDPATRFTEDALRILRLFRFAAQLNFSIDPDTFSGATACKYYLADISAERVQAELGKLLLAPHPGTALEYMADCSVLAEVLPEFAPCIGFEQHTPYHNRTIDRHIIAAVDAAPANLPIRLALLLHDIGKPHCFSLDEAGIGHFKGHDRKSAQLADAVLLRLRFDNITREQVVKLIQLHHFSIPIQAYHVKHLLSEHGTAFIIALLQVCLADTTAKDPDKAHQRLDELLAISSLANQILETSPPLHLKDLAVNGSDLLEDGCPPGPLVGKVLRQLLDYVLLDPTHNNKSALLAFARKLYSKNM